MSNIIEEHIISAFKSQGINTDGFLYAIHTDMDLKGNYVDVYTAIDNEKIIFLSGVEKIKKADGPRRLTIEFEAAEIKAFELKELGGLFSEKLLSSGRLCHEKDGEIFLLSVFSLGFLRDVEKLIKVYDNLKSGQNPLTDVNIDNDTHCSICGSRYPEIERKICPKCLDRTSISLRLLKFFSNYRKKVIVILMTMLAGSVFAIFAPLVGTKLLFDDVLSVGGKYYGAVLSVVLLILLVRIIGLGLNILYSYVLAKTVPWIVQDLKMKIFEAMQKLSVGFFTSKRTGTLMNRVNADATNIYWFFVDGLPYVVVNILTFTGVIIMMLILSWKLALVCLVILPVTIIFFRILWSIFRRFHHKFWAYSSLLNSMVSDSVNGQRVIKAFSREDDEAKRFEITGRKQAGIDTQSINLEFTAFPLIYLFMFFGQVIITAYGGYMVVSGEITLGTLLTFIAYLSMLYGPLEFMSWVSNWWARCVDSAQRVFEIIDAKPDVDDPENPVQINEIKGDISMNNVTFEYDPATPVLKNLNLQVRSGEMLGIVGKTGAGKSTLVNLIARLYDTTEGSVYIDSINVKNLPLDMLRKNIGIVSQDIYLFIGTIADNISYAKPGAGMDEIICASKAAAAHDFIMQLPDAYETRVGAGGQDLSGGEKQRLSIARTILQNPKILILDEATAAMDTQTEISIQEALSKLKEGRTTIAIAHRLSTLKDADNLAVISEGKVVEQGTHVELLEKKGEYHKLYLIQQEGLKIIQMDV